MLADFETKTKTKFSCYNADKSFGNIAKYRKEVFQQDCLPWLQKKITTFLVQLASRDFLFASVNRLLEENS